MFINKSLQWTHDHIKVFPHTTNWGCQVPEFQDIPPFHSGRGICCHISQNHYFCCQRRDSDVFFSGTKILRWKTFLLLCPLFYPLKWLSLLKLSKHPYLPACLPATCLPASWWTFVWPDLTPCWASKLFLCQVPVEKIRQLLINYVPCWCCIRVHTKPATATF